MLTDVQGLFEVVASSDEQIAGVQRALNTLADEINSCLPEYECRFVHLDTGDFLEFLPRDVADSEPF